MRLWSLHPQYLDSKGLVALWREGLLAQAVLSGKTQGYRHHPQLARFLRSPMPEKYIAAYLRAVQAEAARRGYRFDVGKISRAGRVEPLPVTRAQLDYEWEQLCGKLRTRAPSWLEQFRSVRQPTPHPIFRVIAGEIAEWEAAATRQADPARHRK